MNLESRESVPSNEKIQNLILQYENKNGAINSSDGDAVLKLAAWLQIQTSEILNFRYVSSMVLLTNAKNSTKT
ncbi:hypothetical protein HN954_00585 [bacterium]|jgi:hypothetical protein|nr:hypothetical protein [bacterium]MBT6832366.1 hypothetical protein [bacterium]MBT6995911.1 hypothetical protein [bacterium]MBT7772772.1 hypothetical protein [bacterium]